MIIIPTYSESSATQRFRTSRISEMMEALEEQLPESAEHGMHVTFDGETSWNGNITMMLVRMEDFHVSPIVPSVLPRKNQNLPIFLNGVINCFNVGYKNLRPLLRLYLLSTTENRRCSMMGEVVTLHRLEEMLKPMPSLMNGAISMVFHGDAPVEIENILRKFPPSEHLVIELIPGKDEEATEQLLSSFCSHGYQASLLPDATIPKDVREDDAFQIPLY